MTGNLAIAHFDAAGMDQSPFDGLPFIFVGSTDGISFVGSYRRPKRGFEIPEPASGEDRFVRQMSPGLAILCAESR